MLFIELYKISISFLKKMTLNVDGDKSTFSHLRLTPTVFEGKSIADLTGHAGKVKGL